MAIEYPIHPVVLTAIILTAIDHSIFVIDEMVSIPHDGTKLARSSEEEVMQS